MKKLKRKISNPMTIIAIFAAVSETSAVVSLPFLNDDEREIYVWFLISFPLYLLFLFFLTLNFNYRSLYAPSDFDKGKHFIKVIDNAERSENKKHLRPNASSARCKRSSTASVSERSPPGFSTGVRRFRCRLWNAQGPLAQIYLSGPLEDLRIIDTRGMNPHVDFTTLVDKIRKPRKNATKVIVFLACNQSEKRLKEGTLRYSRHKNKSASKTFYIVYNLNSQDVTVLDQT
jgi:hypothetical protein